MNKGKVRNSVGPFIAIIAMILLSGCISIGCRAPQEKRAQLTQSEQEFIKYWH